MFSKFTTLIIKNMGIQERKVRNRKEMEKHVLDAAMKLYLKEGYKNVTIRKIAKTIEYSPATIYLYFKDKEEIFFTLQKLGFKKFYTEQLSVQTIKDPVKRLIAHGEVYVKFALENKEYYDLMFITSEPVFMFKDRKDWDTGVNSYDLLKQNVKSCIDAGFFKSKDVETTAFALWSFVHGVSSLLIKRGFMIPDEFKKHIVKGSLEILGQIINSKQ
jgi:AcrR family transcriptional regulator